MKKVLWVILILVVSILGLYIYSHARKDISLPHPEDMTGAPASPLMPHETSGGQPSARGSAELKLTGPVWVESEK